MRGVKSPLSILNMKIKNNLLFISEAALLFAFSCFGAFYLVDFYFKIIPMIFFEPSWFLRLDYVHYFPTILSLILPVLALYILVLINRKFLLPAERSKLYLFSTILFVSIMISLPTYEVILLLSMDGGLTIKDFIFYIVVISPLLGIGYFSYIKNKITLD
ncbi:MAG: hypothetical protein RLZZ230_406 [Candidatus Parcubacteria bacterium]|jgi:hypothetical protein